MLEKTRVLFLSEAVTWSQVVRLLVLARGLDRRRYDVSFAASSFALLSPDDDFRRCPIWSLSPETIDQRVSRGGRIYDRRTLARYVDDELALFARVRPHVVVSDLRWSTAISAEVAGVPLITMVNAYWSRRAVRRRFPIPDHAIVRLLGVERVEKGFDRALPFVLRHFAAPVNALRRAHGLPPLGDLIDVMEHGDRLIFPDDPALVPLASPSPREVFLGPITWTPDVPAHDGEHEVYVTLGSSGALDALPRVLEAVDGLPVRVLVSTARRAFRGRVPANVEVREAVRGDVAARRAKVVVCNGGASTAHQALAQGTPVVGLPSNLDACLAMTSIEEYGAGIMLRASTATSDQLRAAIVRAMDERAMRARATQLAASFARFDPHARFAEALDAVLSSQEPQCAWAASQASRC